MKKTLTICLFMLPAVLFGQNVEFDKSIFKDKKTEFKEAVNNLEEGDAFYSSEPFALYHLAIPFYEKANAFNPNNATLNLKLGICYLNTVQKFKSLPFFEKAYKLNPNVSPNIHYYLGRGLQLSQSWTKAIAAYETFIKSANPKEFAKLIEDANKHIYECNSGIKLEASPVRVWIDNMGPEVNTEGPEYGMIMNADASEIYFTSRRPNTTGEGKDMFTQEWYEDIYMSKRVNGGWTQAVNVGDPLNSKGHDATASLNSDASKMVIYLDDKGDGNLYESVKKNGVWSKPKKIDDICTEYHESSAWYSSDGQKIYFVSDRPSDGKRDQTTGRDIYVASWNPSKKRWDNIQRLPDNVNTKYDEDGVFLHPDGKTLYFSSKGHNSMGGYDIFYSKLQETGTWTNPVNIGYPINTPDHDVFFVVTASGKTAYMTSFRTGGLGEKDLYKITFIGEEKPPLLNTEDALWASTGIPVSEKVIEPKVEVRKSEMALLKGTVRDAKSNKPLEASIELIDNTTNTVLAEFTSDAVTGKFLVSLPSGKNYGIAVKVNGYLFHSENFEIPKESDYQEISKDVLMKKMEVGEVIVLRNIFFDLNKYSLRNESQNELDRLTKLMQDNPSIRILISGHTDSRGSATLNKELSANRAKAVVDYLVSKGIDKKRLESQGFGKEQPIISDEAIAKLKSEKAKEHAHQSNRRTEFKIISK